MNLNYKGRILVDAGMLKTVAQSACLNGAYEPILHFIN